MSDDGAGISRQDQPHVFDPFFTTRLREGGSGLGLSVVHGIVMAHGGRVVIQSAPDRGTSVQIWFPLGSGASVDATDGALDEGSDGAKIGEPASR